MFERYKIKSYERAEVMLYALREEVRGHLRVQTALQPEAVNRGSPNCGPPRFTVRPAATFVNYVGAIKITQ